MFCVEPENSAADAPRRRRADWRPVRAHESALRFRCIEAPLPGVPRSCVAGCTSAPARQCDTRCGGARGSCSFTISSRPAKGLMEAMRIEVEAVMIFHVATRPWPISHTLPAPIVTIKSPGRAAARRCAVICSKRGRCRARWPLRTIRSTRSSPAHPRPLSLAVAHEIDVGNDGFRLRRRSSPQNPRAESVCGCAGVAETRRRGRLG